MISIFYLFFLPDDSVAVMMYGESTSPAVIALSKKLIFLNPLVGCIRLQMPKCEGCIAYFCDVTCNLMNDERMTMMMNFDE